MLIYISCSYNLLINLNKISSFQYSRWHAFCKNTCHQITPTDLSEEIEGLAEEVEEPK